MIDNYIETYTGIAFDFVNPKPEHFNILDIAHSLSMTCRFTGHCRVFYSVAEHSWHMSRMLTGCSKEIQLAALLHDAAEAYLTDLASPIKAVLPEYSKLEDNVMQVLFNKYGLEYPLHPAVKAADRAMLSIESNSLLTSRGDTWKMWENSTRPVIDIAFKPIGMGPKQAKEVFLEKYSELTAWR